MSGKAFVRSLFLTIVVSFFVAVASFAQKKAVSQPCDTVFFCAKLATDTKELTTIVRNKERTNAFPDIPI